jgi:hypothetical protein
LSLAVRSREVYASSIRRIGASIELLVARSLKRRSKVYESVSLYSKFPRRISRIENGCSLNAAQSASERLRVGLPGKVDDAGLGSGDGGQDNESGAELHFELERKTLRWISEQERM